MDDGRPRDWARQSGDESETGETGGEQFDLFGAPAPPAEPASPPSRRGNGVKPAAPSSPSTDAEPPRRASARTATLWGDDEPDAGDGEAEPGGEETEAASAESGAASPAKPKPKRRAREVLPAPPSSDVLDAANALPPHVHLGTSSWSFPGWQGIVYGDEYSNSKLARDGLAAYGAHPLLRTVSIDRSFYQPLTLTDYLRYAQQVPDHFRFIVKAPASVTDATVRAERGEPVAPNPCFLNARLAADEFVRPCLDGLGAKAGALVFQFSPLPDPILAEPAGFIERLAQFFAALPPLPEGPCYAVEIRDACLLTPRFIRMLRACGVRYCVGLHARMPDPLRQAAALALLDGDEPSGPLIVRWSLHQGFKYEQAKAKYDPFNRLVDEDPNTRAALAELAARYALAGQAVLITINNKAEGSAPLSCVELGREIAAACGQMRGEGPAL
ncbi:DUF72 domain-containing protein [Trinickia terrae]|uniref:DUF72 domain-containing protein n=1 Tax=Trinickia terrae TaxID=2571161 RepID=A0A4U1HRC0_9BURK|nr:DUF72 domain-containing protein [Trinickia terrae]TKC82893.1 DUF72 domain-containing protein [Trinickia terrae]